MEPQPEVFIPVLAPTLVLAPVVQPALASQQVLVHVPVPALVPVPPPTYDTLQPHPALAIVQTSVHDLIDKGTQEHKTDLFFWRVLHCLIF